MPIKFLLLQPFFSLKEKKKKEQISMILETAQFGRVLVSVALRGQSSLVKESKKVGTKER